MHAPVLLLFLAASRMLAADDSDLVMPGIVSKSKSTVEVLMRHTPPTGECFPDPSARVRIVDGVIQLSDLALYPHMQANLSEGLVAFQQGLLWGACDKTGRVIIQPKHDSSFRFSSGLAGVRKGGLYGFIDKEAGWVIKPTLDTDYTGDFVGDVCPVRIGGRNAVIDKKGHYIWQPGLLQAVNLGGGIYIQTSDKRAGFLNDQGVLILNGAPNMNYYKESP